MDVVMAARSLVGTPFHHGGRLPGVGLDCIGVAACAAQLAGFSVRDVLAYPLRPNGMLRPLLEERLLSVPIAYKAPGDLLLMALGDEGVPHHIAVYTGPTIIHAHIDARRCVEQDFTDWFADRTVGVYRFPELG